MTLAIIDKVRSKLPLLAVPTRDMSADAHLPRSLHFSKRELGAYGWPRHTATALGILYDRVLINAGVLPYYYPPQAEVTLDVVL